MYIYVYFFSLQKTLNYHSLGKKKYRKIMKHQTKPLLLLFLFQIFYLGKKNKLLLLLKLRAESPSPGQVTSCQCAALLTLSQQEHCINRARLSFHGTLLSNSRKGCSCLSAVICPTHCAACLPRLFSNLHSALPEASSDLEVLC